MKLPAEVLEQIRHIYGQGRYLQAHALGLAHAPLKKWEGTEGRVMAGRIAGNLGGEDLARALFRLAWRSDPQSAEAAYYMASGVHERRGLLEAWEWTRERGDWPDAPAKIRADWLALRARYASEFRDFDTAERLLREAFEIEPDRAWIHIEKAFILKSQDRYEEALEAALHAGTLRPGYNPAVRFAADLLQMVGRDHEALERLQPAARAGESCHNLLQLGALELELGLLADARSDFEKALETAILAEAPLKAWIHAKLSDVARQLGDAEAAAAHATASELPSYAEYAKRAASGEKGRRVLLPVPFVRQHHVTCAPATLTALSRFWSRSADHLEVAERICYDGTPNHSERAWAEQEGWAVREFRVTWESAKHLIDKGIPFTLSLTGPRMGHLQAVAGYDEFRQTLLVRDPTHRGLLEYDAPAFLESPRRGMALAPPEKKGELESLPDAAKYDQHHAVVQALEARNRDAAQRAIDAMQADDPDHRLVRWARRSLASYDGDRPGHLKSVEELLAIQPDDESLILARLELLGDLAKQAERVDALRAQAARPGSFPGFLQMLAEELMVDARQFPEAERVLRKCVRRLPDDASGYESLSRICWYRGERDRAVELVRFASCLRDKDERLASSYFFMAHAIGRSDAALETLKARNRRFGAKSSGPARTLHWAYERLGRTGDARDVLEAALRARPEDGSLMLYAAEQAALHGEFAAASDLMERARTRSRPIELLRSEALVAAVRGDPESALDRWRRLAELDPADVDSHAEVVRLLGESGRRSAAGTHLQESLARSPHLVGLHALRVTWLREESPAGEEIEQALGRLLELNPRNAWAVREMAVSLARRGRIDQALVASAEAIDLEPYASSSHATRALVYRLAGRPAERADSARAALRISVGALSAIADLVDAQAEAADKRRALQFVRDEIARQPVPGDALGAWRERAMEYFKPEEIASDLKSLWTARPDLWTTWEALVLQLSDAGGGAEAVELGRKAAEKFPLVARIWVALGQAARAAGAVEEERRALHRALELTPDLVAASHALAASYQRTGEIERERDVLTAAVRFTPLEPVLHEARARCLWRLGRKDEALAAAVHSVRLRPGFEDGWARIQEWGLDLGKPDEAVRVARELAESRPGDAMAWVAWARIPRPLAELPDRLAALDRALALEPRLLEALDLKAVLLAEAGRFDEAIALCQTREGSGRGSTALKGRGFWLEAQRGEMGAAIQGMMNLLQEDPGYYWGWSLINAWNAQSNPPLALKAAEEMVRINPQDAYPLALLAESRERVKNTEGAKIMYRKALHASPDWTAPAVRLIDLHLADREFDQAEEVIGRIRGPHREGMRTERRVKVWLARGDWNKAAKLLEDLAVSPDREALSAATGALVKEGEWFRASEALERAIAKGNVIPEAGFQWARCVVSGRSWSLARRGLRRLKSQPAVWSEAAACYVEALADAGDWRAVDWFVFWNKSRLRKGLHSWASTGYALLTRLSARRAMKWMKDWESRPEAESWMLINMTAALRILGRNEEAGRVSRAALARPEDHGTPLHRMWLAFDVALDGPVEAARHALAAVDVSGLTSYWRFVKSLGYAVLEARAGEGTRAERFAKARQGLDKALADLEGPVNSPEARMVWRRAVRRIARERGGIVGWMWQCWALTGK